MQRNISKKPIIILGSLLTLLIVVTIIYGVSSAKNKELKLEQLIDTSYEVLDVRRHKKEKTYEVDIQAELSYADNILLANKLLKELEKHDQTNAVKLNMNVYQQKPTKMTKDSVDFTDQAYRYTIETNGSYIYQYEPLHTADLTNDLLFSTEWEIKDSQLSKNELTFSAILPKTLSPEEVTSLLNELADEMIRYNFKNIEKASATIQSEISDTETYYYLSGQPNYLIYKTRLIG